MDAIQIHTHTETHTHMHTYTPKDKRKYSYTRRYSDAHFYTHIKNGSKYINTNEHMHATQIHTYAGTKQTNRHKYTHILINIK